MSGMREKKANVRFSDEFKRRVNAVLGDAEDENVRKLLDTNAYFIGRYINDAMDYCNCGCTKDSNTEFGKKQIELSMLYKAWDTYFFVEPHEETII